MSQHVEMEIELAYLIVGAALLVGFLVGIIAWATIRRPQTDAETLYLLSTKRERISHQESFPVSGRQSKKMSLSERIWGTLPMEKKLSSEADKDKLAFSKSTSTAARGTQYF